MARRTYKTTVEGALILTVLIMLFWAAIGAFVWPYAINSWLAFFGKAQQVTWWQGALIGFVPSLGKYGVPLAFLTWLIMLFLN